MAKNLSTFVSTRRSTVVCQLLVNFSQLVFGNMLKLNIYIAIIFVNFSELMQLLTTLFNRVVNCQLNPLEIFNLGPGCCLNRRSKNPGAGLATRRPGSQSEGISDGLTNCG